MIDAKEKIVITLPILDAYIWSLVQSKRFEDAEKELIDLVDYYSEEQWPLISWNEMLQGTSVMLGDLTSDLWKGEVRPMIFRVILETSQDDDEIMAIYRALNPLMQEEFKRMAKETPATPETKPFIPQPLIPIETTALTPIKISIQSIGEDKEAKPLFIHTEKPVAEAQKRPSFMSFNLPFFGKKKEEMTVSKPVKADVMAPKENLQPTTYNLQLKKEEIKPKEATPVIKSGNFLQNLIKKGTQSKEEIKGEFAKRNMTPSVNNEARSMNKTEVLKKPEEKPKISGIFGFSLFKKKEEVKPVAKIMNYSETRASTDDIDTLTNIAENMNNAGVMKSETRIMNNATEERVKNENVGTPKLQPLGVGVNIKIKMIDETKKPEAKPPENLPIRSTDKISNV